MKKSEASKAVFKVSAELLSRADLMVEKVNGNIHFMRRECRFGNQFVSGLELQSKNPKLTRNLSEAACLQAVENENLEFFAGIEFKLCLNTESRAFIAAAALVADLIPANAEAEKTVAICKQVKTAEEFFKG